MSTARTRLSRKSSNHCVHVCACRIQKRSRNSSSHCQSATLTYECMQQGDTLMEPCVWAAVCSWGCHASVCSWG